MQTKSKMRTRVGEINRDIVAAQHWQQILEIAVEHSSIYDSVNTSTSLHRIASKKPSEDDMQVIFATQADCICRKTLWVQSLQAIG